MVSVVDEEVSLYIFFTLSSRGRHSSHLEILDDLCEVQSITFAVRVQPCYRNRQSSYLRLTTVVRRDVRLEISVRNHEFHQRDALRRPGYRQVDSTPCSCEETQLSLILVGNWQVEAHGVPGTPGRC